VSVCLQILKSFNISGTDKLRSSFFGKWIHYGTFHLRDEKFPMKGAWSGSRVGVPYAVQIWQVSGSTTASPTLRAKKFQLKGAWSGSRDRFWDEASALFKFRKWIEYGECHHGVKNPPPETGVVSVT